MTDGRIHYGRDVRVVGTGQYMTGTPDSIARLREDGGRHMPQGAYVAMLDHAVSACVDLVLICPDGEVLLGLRRQEPHPDWWIIGGRMFAWETFFEAADRNAQRELGIKLDPDRFDDKPLGAFTLMWDRRAQEPQDKGRHDLSLPFIYRLTDEELAALNHNREYAGLRIFRLEEVIGNIAYHPALSDILEAAKARLAA